MTKEMSRDAAMRELIDASGKYPRIGGEYKTEFSVESISIDAENRTVRIFDAQTCVCVIVPLGKNFTQHTAACELRLHKQDEKKFAELL